MDVVDTCSGWPSHVIAVLDRWAGLGSVVLPDGARLIGHVPEVAELAYLHRVPPPLPEEGLNKLRAQLEMPVPAELLEFYKCANGLSAFSDSLNIYGLRGNYRRSDMLAVSAQPYDIITPNQHERPAQMKLNHVIVGGYQYDGSKVAVGDQAEVYRCERRDGRKRLNQWPSFRAWIEVEIDRLSKVFDDAGHCPDREETLPR